MEKRKKAVAVIAALFFIILSTNIVLAEMPNPTDKFYVNDYAEVLSDAQEEELCADGEQLYEETTAQVVVLIPQMEKKSVIMQMKWEKAGALEIQRITMAF